MKFRLPVIFLMLFGFCLLLRWGSFLPSVINHDESTYIVIADEILRGETYLRESIDTKPVGLFWLYAGIHLLTGGSIAGFRIIATLFVALTAFFLFLSGRRVMGSDRVAWAAGLSYPVMCSLFTYYGLSPNTELYINAFTSCAVYLAIARIFGPKISSDSSFPNWWSYALAGLLLGIAATIKPVVVAEAVAIGLFLLWWGLRSRRLQSAVFRVCLPLTAFFFLPLAGVFYYYYAQGMTEELFFYNWELTKRYPVEKAWYLRLKFMGDYALRYSPLLLLSVAAIRESRDQDRHWQGFLLLQLALVSCVVLWPGKTFGHYQVQLHPALAALAATWWSPLRKRQRILRRLPARRGVTLLLVLAVAFGISLFLKYQARTDEGRDIAAWFNANLAESEQFLMVNNNQIVYHLANRPVPTPYVHTSLLFYDHHVRALDLDLTSEVQQLRSNQNLRYAVIRIDEGHLDHPIMEWIRKDFVDVHSISDKFMILKRSP